MIENRDSTEEDVEAGVGSKILLTLFPFLAIVLFLFLEWWIRGRS